MALLIDILAAFGAVALVTAIAFAIKVLDQDVH
jgi:hypothetical protein